MRLHPATLAAATLPVLALAAFSLAGCNGTAPAPDASASASAQPASAKPDVGPDAPAGLGIRDATIRLPAVPGNPGVAYFTLTAEAGPAQKVVAVHVDGFERAEMHESRTENGVSTMAQVTSVTVAPNKPLEFKPGGLHVMLFDPATPLPREGDMVELTLTLENGDKISASAQVQAAGGDDGMAGMDHM